MFYTRTSMFGLSALLLGAVVASPPFHRTVTPPYSFVNTIVRLRFDLARELVYGRETAVVKTARDVASIPFDTSGIAYQDVRVNDRPAAYRLDVAAERLTVDLPSRARAGATLTVTFNYRTHPKAGLYFVKPDNTYPALTPEIWTQGEPTDNRRWFPTWDEPNAKTPSELIVTVPRDWTVIGNGYLKSQTFDKSEATWDWRSPEPKSTYLIAFAAGPLSRYHSALGHLNVDSYVPPRYAGVNALCFGDTNRMIAYYDRLFGVAYPFAKYDQVAAERDFFGGMENESITIIASKALHPQLEEPQRSCDLVVSHELAQHWFGDDATMMDWSNVWLNEGFATYFDEVWTGERDGRDAFDYARYEAQQAYFAEARGGFRPVVDYRYTDPLELFDAIGHEGAAERIHMLRYLAGDRRFFSAIRAYLIRYQYRNATTQQFFASLAQSLGTDLRWFQDEWFFRASYPVYDVGFAYDAAHRRLTLQIAQSSPDGTMFRMPVEIAVYASGRVRRTRIVMGSRDRRVVIDGVGSRPDMVLFDPGNDIVRQLHVAEPVTMLAFQARHAPDVPDRLWAIDRLGDLAHQDTRTHDVALTALRAAGAEDHFYGVRAAAVANAARFDDSTGVETGLRDDDVRVRLAALDSSATLKSPSPSVVRQLNALTSAQIPDVAAAALTAIGTLRLPGSYAVLVRALDVQSFQQTVASGALQGLAALGDARAYALIVARTAYGVDENERNHAVAALGQLAASLHRESDALPHLVTIATDDRIVSTRLAAIVAIATMGDPAALPVLHRLAQHDPLAVVRVTAASAIRRI